MSDQTRSPSKGILTRANTPFFVAICVLCGLLGSAVLFVTLGLSTQAFGASTDAAALIALLGMVIGFVMPIVYLRRKRFEIVPTRRDPPSFSAGAATDSAAKETVPGNEASGESHSTAEWFYADGGKRVGPVSADHIQRLTAGGDIPKTTLVWRRGMPDWIKLADTELLIGPDSESPPPLSATGMANGVIWALALAPLWGAILHYIGVYFYLTAKYGLVIPAFAQEMVWKTWYVPFAINWSLALADEHALRAAGWKSEKLNKWLALLVPVYIYKRDQLVGANMTRFWVWIGSAIASVLLV